MGAGLGPGQPLRFARRAGQAAIVRKRQLERDLRASFAGPGQVTRNTGPAFVALQLGNRDPGGADSLDPGPGGAWIGIAAADHHPRQSACRDQIGAGRAARRDMGAGF
jgi:hypothetical protein